MIARSDNTATDMILNQVGHERVQAFVDAIGLRATPIPASLRQLIAYDAGFAAWQTITWEQLTSDSPTGPPQPILNEVIAMASTPDDLVSFFSRALRGEFFRFAETLDVFRAILSTADAIAARCRSASPRSGRAAASTSIRTAPSPSPAGCMSRSAGSMSA